MSRTVRTASVVLPGRKIEIIASADPENTRSAISLTFDDRPNVVHLADCNKDSESEFWRILDGNSVLLEEIAQTRPRSFFLPCWGAFIRLDQT